MSSEQSGHVPKLLRLAGLRGGCACTFWFQLIALVASSDPGTCTILSRYRCRASFLLFFPACVDCHSLKPSLWLRTEVFHVSYSFCHSLHLPLFSHPVATVKCIKFHGFITIYRSSPAKTLSHTPKMRYGEVLNNIAWGSLPKICKTFY